MDREPSGSPVPKCARRKARGPGFRAAFLLAALACAPAFAQQGKPELRPTQAPAPLPPGGAIAKPTDMPGFAEATDPFAAYQRGFYATAFQLALKRVETNKTDAAAMTLLGQLYREGAGAPKDPREAARWFRLAADLGDPNAAFAYGVSLLKGDGVALDRAAAEKQFKRAAEKDHAEALYNLGVMAIEDAPGAPDFKKATDYFLRGAAAGSADSAYSLGVLYRNGRGADQNNVEAANWFKQAAEADNVPGMVEFAIMQFNGEGVLKDEAGAARWFLKAAQRNNPVAQNRAARLLAAGRGVQPNLVEAMKWHLLARNAGIQDEWLDGRLTELTTSQRAAVEEAVKKFSGG